MATAEVLVVGAGIIGLTTAVTLAEAGHQVTVVADEIPGLTSLAAGASWGPYHVKPYHRVSWWSRHTLKVLTELADVASTGVQMVSGIEASRTAVSLPDWAAELPDVKECRGNELPAGFRTGWRYTVPVIDMPRHLGYLLRRLAVAGGLIEERYVANLNDVTAKADAVVNCSGLGARDLAADDSMYPIRGQLVVVSNPGIDTFFSEDTRSSPDLTHYLPQGDTVILGGLAVPGDASREPDPATAEAIIARCFEIEPMLRQAQVLEHRVGLRPTRPQIRLDMERLDGTLLIHSYGHGGAGASLSWGCAAETEQLIR